MPNQKLFDHLLIFVNLHQHGKNEAVSSVCSGEMVDSKILPSEWLQAFWSISQEQDLSQIEDLCRNKEKIKNFYYRTNSGNVMMQQTADWMINYL